MKVFINHLFTAIKYNSKGEGMKQNIKKYITSIWSKKQTKISKQLQDLMKKLLQITGDI